MRATKRRDTKPELAIRSLLHAAGLRYRVDFRVGTGRSAPRPDIAFTRHRIAVFVDGCFWHQCPLHATVPKTNEAFWAAKLRRNSQRDRENDAALRSLGWTVVRVWEHEPPAESAARIIQAIRNTSKAGIATPSGQHASSHTQSPIA